MTAVSNDNSYNERCHLNQSKQDHSMPNQRALPPHNCTACGHDQYNLAILNPTFKAFRRHKNPYETCQSMF
jgi:hypothetical protein